VNEQRAREAVEHLQSAAIEVIASMRAFLDVAEDLVRDPAQLAAVVEHLVPRPPAPAPARTDEASTVTRIRVS
jgi:hypothetical protein